MKEIMQKALDNKSHSGKPYLTDLPHDLRTNDRNKLLERKKEILKEIFKLHDKLEKYPLEFFEIALDVNGEYNYNGDFLFEYDGLTGQQKEINELVRQQYMNTIKDIHDEIKDINNTIKEDKTVLEDINKKSNKESKNFNKLQKEYLENDDKLTKELENPKLMEERENTIQQIKDMWDNYDMQNPYHYYETYGQEREFRDYDLTIPLTNREYNRFVELRNNINNNIKILDNLYKNGVLTTPKQQEIINEIRDNIQEYGDYIREPYEFDIDEIAGLRGNATTSLPKLLNQLNNVPLSVKPLKDNTEKLKNRLNESKNKIEEYENQKNIINNNIDSNKNRKKYLRQRENNLKKEIPNKVNNTSRTPINELMDYTEQAIQFRDDLNKVHSYYDELVKVNDALPFEDAPDLYHGLKYEYGNYEAY